MTIGTLTVTAPRTASARTRRMVLLAVLLVLAMFVAPRAIAGGDAVPVESVLTTYTVATGDTLWSIASSLTPVGEDVTEKLAEIQEINRMATSQLAAGEQILIPLAG
ncbi:LysM peptidoglycan-binding domain-containing protein [Demequina capsici]|uniref:LysM peptidoglycan-binding domain-containing protein n=1 Tax=Demequina capsici TaxID=3075620 RepID=A0AA96J5S0_9MICO|nr:MULTISPECIES: LysM peptidoglycan-binding domain-containing protein [unclassified Demequina]WNM23367.1 LysM peptidoglycan-binding domain-containing protein [Demequina sp. OYTSA14]WNM26244.1 LysM peptidoglycan-binding domain-containing protein [Demequina sp. PMTSA13]